MTLTGTTIPYTPVEVMFELLRRCEGRLGFAASADSIGTTYIEDVSEFQNTLFGDTDFQDSYIYRYKLPDNDRVKIITTNTPASGRVSHGGLAYGNNGAGADLDYMFLTVHPDELFNCLRNAQHRIYVPGMGPLSAMSDADMAWPNEDWWNGALGGSSMVNASVAKTSDSDKVDSGRQSLVVTLTGNGGLVAGEMVEVQPYQTVFSAVNVANAGGGPITYKLWDVDHSAYIGTQYDPIYAGRRFATLPRSDSIPAGCYRVQPVVSGTLSGDVFYWDSTFGPWACGDRRFPLPPWANASYKVQYVYEAHYNGVPQVSPQVLDSASRRYQRRYQTRVDFDVENFHTGANPYHLSFRASANPNWQRPLWMQTNRLAHDAEPITAVTTQLRSNFEEFVAYCMWDVAKLGRAKQPQDPFWAELQNDYATYAAVQTIADQDPGAQPTVQRYRQVL